MQLFCANCEENVTDNIAVYENVDGVIVHCGDCNFPIMFIGYDEPNWFGNDGELNMDNFTPGEEMSEEQLNLYDEDTQCDCDRCSEECEEAYEQEKTTSLMFTTEDLDQMEKAMIAKTKRLRKSLDTASELLDKLQTLQAMRRC
jgi:hypothetical protein